MGILVVEYDVLADGAVEIVALISAEEQSGSDPDSLEWLAWRDSVDDARSSYIVMPPDAVAAIDSTEDDEEILAIIERAVVEGHNAKETTQ